MKWLADENISRSAIDLLRSHGHDVLTVASLAPGALDEDVIRLAEVHQCVLLSFDRDHGDLIFGQGVAPPPAVVYLRLYPASPEATRKLLSGVLALGDALIGQFTVVIPDGIRQRALPAPK